MEDAYRIIDRFEITGRGTVYIIDDASSLKIEDVLCDLHGSRFRLKGVEMCCRPRSFDDMMKNRGIMLELLDGVEVKGTLLLHERGNIHFLFCCDPLDRRKVDERYAKEWEAAIANGYMCGLFSYEDMEQGKLSTYGESFIGLTVYRGWMMKPDMYRLLYGKLKEKGIVLINSPEEYEKYHLLPGWYGDFKEETAESVWTEGTELSQVLEKAKLLKGAYIVKDYVKSRKHEWYDACYIRNVQQHEELERVVRNFVRRQGESLVGGVVLRKFERMRKMGYHETSGMPISEEYRVFLLGGEILTVSSYWNEDKGLSLADSEVEWIRQLAGRVNSNFATMDVARKEDGSLMVVEFGDGQVSGLQYLDAAEFYKAVGRYERM